MECLYNGSGYSAKLQKYEMVKCETYCESQHGWSIFISCDLRVSHFTTREFCESKVRKAPARVIIIIMSLTPVSSSDKDIGGVPSMQSSYSEETKRNGICMEERSVHCKCVGRNPRRHCAGY